MALPIDLFLDPKRNNSISERAQGDWASVDEDGCWFLHGRADESMNVAGRKVGPAEVEQGFLEHPAVSEAAVIGVPDELKTAGDTSTLAD